MFVVVSYKDDTLYLYNVSIEATIKFLNSHLKKQTMKTIGMWSFLFPLFFDYDDIIEKYARRTYRKKNLIG